MLHVSLTSGVWKTGYLTQKNESRSFSLILNTNQFQRNLKSQGQTWNTELIEEKVGRALQDIDAGKDLLKGMLITEVIRSTSNQEDFVD